MSQPVNLRERNKEILFNCFGPTLPVTRAADARTSVLRPGLESHLERRERATTVLPRTELCAVVVLDLVQL